MISDTRTFRDIVLFFVEIIDTLLPLLAALSLLVFIWGLAKFIFVAGNDKQHKAGRDLMVWGLIALFVLVSIYGILNLFYQDAGFARPFGSFLLPE